MAYVEPQHRHVHVYKGEIIPPAGPDDPVEFRVTVDGELLNPRLDLRNHSPTGFMWGYAGSGPAQLALAILAHEFGDEMAQNDYQEFKWAAIATLPGDQGFEITSEELRGLFSYAALTL